MQRCCLRLGVSDSSRAFRYFDVAQLAYEPISRASLTTSKIKHLLNRASSHDGKYCADSFAVEAERE